MSDSKLVDTKHYVCVNCGFNLKVQSSKVERGLPNACDHCGRPMKEVGRAAYHKFIAMWKVENDKRNTVFNTVSFGAQRGNVAPFKKDWG